MYFKPERYFRDVRAGLHNPPMGDNVINMLAADALKESLTCCKADYNAEVPAKSKRSESEL